MVYANAFHATAAHAAPRHRLDGTRITAGAGAIAANVAVLLLMLAPMAVPQLRPELPRVQDIVWVPRERPTPPPPAVVPITPVRAVVRPTPAAAPRPIAAPTFRCAPACWRRSPPPLAARAGRLRPGGPPQVVGTPAARRQYASAPPPPYPRDALRGGLTGTVVLEVLVGVDGRPLRAEVLRSSGHRLLDQAARRQVLSRWMFKPALQGGMPVQALGRVPVEFRLEH